MTLRVAVVGCGYFSQFHRGATHSQLAHAKVSRPNWRDLTSVHASPGGDLLLGLAVPRFFFETQDGDRLTPDLDGLVLPDLETARAEALKALPEMARDVLPDGEDRTVSVLIQGEDGQGLFRASLTLRCEWLVR